MNQKYYYVSEKMQSEIMYYIRKNYNGKMIFLLYLILVNRYQNNIFKFEFRNKMEMWLN